MKNNDLTPKEFYNLAREYGIDTTQDYVRILFQIEEKKKQEILAGLNYR